MPSPTFPNSSTALAMIYKLAEAALKSWRRLDTINCQNSSTE
jgi:hypothetical protein